MSTDAALAVTAAAVTAATGMRADLAAMLAAQMVLTMGGQQIPSLDRAAIIRALHDAGVGVDQIASVTETPRPLVLRVIRVKQS